MSALEKRITAALSSEVGSGDIAALIEETETAIIDAAKAAEREREKALDLVASADAAKARQAMEDAAFKRDRLRAVLPRLNARLADVSAAEYGAAWAQDYERVKAKVEDAARKYGQYPALVAQLVELLDTNAVDKEVSRINGSAPLGEDRRLRRVELTARGLQGFTRDVPSIGETVQLPDWERSAKTAWPLPQPSLAALVAQSMGVPGHPGADWAIAQQQDNIRRAKNEERWREEEAERQVKSRETYEASLRR